MRGDNAAKEVQIFSEDSVIERDYADPIVPALKELKRRYIRKVAVAERRLHDGHLVSNAQAALPEN
jgi:hypothetical protein